MPCKKRYLQPGMLCFLLAASLIIFGKSKKQFKRPTRILHPLSTFYLSIPMHSILKTKTSLLLFVSMFIHFYSPLQANIRLPQLFTSHMVLQRDRAIPLWGWADPKETITVTFKGQTQTVVAGKDGTWRITLKPEPTGGPFDLSFKGKNQIVLQDILLGDVWICSGQSNMEWEVEETENAPLEIANANFPQIRHFKINKTLAITPQSDVPSGGWNICSPETVSKFTAVGYFFARELNQQLRIPIGLINTSWGGTMVETWISKEAFAQNPDFKDMIADLPVIDLDSLSKVKKAVLNRHVQSLQGPFSDSSTIAQWKNLHYNDEKWPTLNAPGNWEYQALGEFDGEVWLRKTFELDSADHIKNALMQLAKIDDWDETYLNGVRIGGMDRYTFLRKYAIPDGLLRKGKNVIAVKVTDTGGGGGIWGDPNDLFLTMDQIQLSLAGAWKFQVANISIISHGIGPNDYPTLLYNAMIAPLIPVGIKGAIWYQGESNADRAEEYQKSFPLMITDWRKRWNQGDFPFYFVQLASFKAQNGNSKQGSTWAELREAQSKTLQLPHTGMAITTDIGNPEDIHPRNKQDVGKRLAALALNNDYGQATVCQGPTLNAMTVDGNRAILSFSNQGTGLMTKDKYGYLRGFEIAGADQKFYYAKAWIENNHVVVFQENVPVPLAVRYGWADDASDNNLYNQEGFPAPPFRTDNWPGITAGRKYKIKP